MDRNIVLAKTAKGHEEVKSRTHGLAQKQRTILIMVDGVATVGDILAKFGGIPEIAATLDALARDGFVEVKGVAGAATAPAACRHRRRHLLLRRPRRGRKPCRFSLRYPASTTSVPAPMT